MILHPPLSKASCAADRHDPFLLREGKFVQEIVFVGFSPTQIQYTANANVESPL